MSESTTSESATPPNTHPPELVKLPPAPTEHLAVPPEELDRKLDEIEMLGEEEAAGWKPSESPITPGMRYLHCSRTINQLVTDRNRAVAIYLAVASLLLTASSSLLSAQPRGPLIVPIETLQYWCFPVTFAVLAILALFVGFLLVRIRIGLIYEVAKMNVLLGLPVGRVSRVRPLSIYSIMQLLISLAGGASASVFAYHMLIYWGQQENIGLTAVVVGIGVALAMMVIYAGAVLVTTAERKLDQIAR